MSYLDKSALRRAANFAPLIKNEKGAYWIYQLTTLLLIVFPLFLKIKFTQPFFIIGLILYLLSLILLLRSMIDFAKPQSNGMNIFGIYKFSRNPMYLGYFMFFLACISLTQSWVLLIILILFQVSSHWIILSEERWCISEFGDEYKIYMKKVRRYL